MEGKDTDVTIQEVIDLEAKNEQEKNRPQSKTNIIKEFRRLYKLEGGCQVCARILTTHEHCESTS